MRLIVCMLCTDDDPFACPTKFRRTYMQLHLEKSHSVVARDLKIVRAESKQVGVIAEWLSVTGASRSSILKEIEVALDREAESLGDGRTASAISGQKSNSENWSPQAMQGLYRNREGLNTAL